MRDLITEYEDGIPIDGERFLPSMAGAIRWEHLHRYTFAQGLAHDLRVLDVASGEGYGSNMLAERAKSVVGVDCSPVCVAHASQKYPKANLRFQVGDITNLPLENGSIDMAVSFETIEHVPSPERALDEMKRVLRKEGILILSTPDKSLYPKGNRFHVAEMGKSEFVCLLQTRFPNVRILGQRVVTGSMLMPVDGNMTGDYGVWTYTNGGTEFGGLADAVYLIAVCSERPLPMLSFGLIEEPSASRRAWQIIDQDYPSLERDQYIWLKLKRSRLWQLLLPLRWMFCSMMRGLRSGKAIR